MQRKMRSKAALVFAAAFLLGAGSAAGGRLSISLDGDGIDIDGDEVVITAEDDSEATISSDGKLEIEGRRIVIAARDRQALARSNAALHRIEERAIEIGFQGAGLAVSALGEAVVAIATGDGHRAERRVEARADRIKDNARELCEELRDVERLQDTLAARLPAFRPFAVIDLDADDCRVDD